MNEKLVYITSRNGEEYICLESESEAIIGAVAFETGFDPREVIHCEIEDATVTADDIFLMTRTALKQYASMPH